MKYRLRCQRGRQAPPATQMPLLRYFLSVGSALMLSLFVVSAYIGPAPSERAAKVSKAATAASLVKIEPARAGGK